MIGIKLKLVDVYEYDEIDKLKFQTDNVFLIIIDVVEGADLMRENVEEGLKWNEGINTVLRDRDVEIRDFDDGTMYLHEIWDAKDIFTGDQQVLMELVNDIVSDTEDEFNHLL